MRRFLFSIFMTLVLPFLATAWAAPVKNLPPVVDPDSQNEKQLSSPDKLDSATITPTKPPPENLAPDRILPTRRFAYSITQVNAGLWGGTLVEMDEQKTSPFIGLSHIDYFNYDRGQELGIELTKDGYVGALAAYRWIWAIGSPFEFYHKIGGGALYQPSENLVSLVNWKRYNLRLAIGAENLMFNRAVRAEFGLLFSGIGLTYQAFLSWAL